MAASYPSSIKSFTTITTGDVIAADDPNDIQNEVTAIETALIDGFAHDLKFTDATYDIGKSGATRPRDIFLSRDLSVGRNTTFAGSITASAQPRAVVYNDGTQSITTATLTALTFDTEEIDVGGLHDTGSNTSRLTIVDAGLYWVRGATVFASNGTGVRQLSLRLNGTTYKRAVNAPGNGSFTSALEVSGIYALSAADYIELVVNQTSGGNLNVGSAATTRSDVSELAIVRLW